MEFDFEQASSKVKETIKKIPPWAWVALAGGVVLGTMALTPKQTAPGIVRATSGGSGGMPVGLGGGDSQSLSAGTDGVLSQLAEDLGELASKNSELETNFNRVSNEFVSYQTNTEKVLGETTKTFETLSSSLAFEQTLNAIPNIYFDGKRDDEQYGAILNAVGTTPSLKTEERERILNKSAGLGNSGVVDPNNKTTVTITDIKSNAQTLASELDRTTRVIANRKEAGLDTSVQEKWLAQLKQ